MTDALALAVDPARALARVVGLGLVSALVAAGYRWYARERVSGGLTTLAGLSAVAVFLNTTAALGEVIGGEAGPLALEAVLFNGAAFLVGGAVAPLGRRVGDRLATDSFAVAGATEVEGEVGQLVRAVGRVVAVELPDDVEDIEGYEPVADETKAELAGKNFLFPRRLTVGELRERLATRLKDDYDVGYVDADVDADGTVTYLALGRRAAGLGPTLAPGEAAVAVRADPPNKASPGDLVQVWATGDGADVGGSDDDGIDDGPQRVATATVRATAGDTVTLAVDDYDAPDLAGGDYRLVTLPTERQPAREFASLLRAADETMSAVTVREGSALDGATVGSVDATVVAVQPHDGAVEPVPSTERALTSGDVVYVVGRPDTLRRVEEAAGGAVSVGSSTSS